MLFLKTLQKICIGCLEVGVCKCFWIHLEKKNTDHADAAFGCSNASLSLTNVRELLPKAASAWSVFFFQMYPKTLANTHLQTPDTYLLQIFQKQRL